MLKNCLKTALTSASIVCGYRILEIGGWDVRIYLLVGITAYVLAVLLHWKDITEERKKFR